MRARAPLALRLAWREIRNERSFAAFFALNLALGLSGFVALAAFKGSVEVTLDERSRGMLGADLELSARRPFTRAEEAAAARGAGPGSVALSEVLLPSMIAGGTRSRLVEIRAVGPEFPLLGEFRLGDGGDRPPGAAAALESEPAAWLAPGLLAQLGVEVGGRVRIGRTDFRVADVVERDNGSGFAMAPRVYVGRSQLAATGLLQHGSRVTHRRLYRLAPGSDVERAAAEVEAGLPDDEVRVRGHRDAAEDVARVVGYLSAFLSLVSLVALFLSGLGCAYLFRRFLFRRLREVAILISLGASYARARSIYVVQLVLLGGAAAAGTLVGVALAAPWVPRLLGGELVPIHVAPRVGAATVGVAVGVALGGSLLLAWPALYRMHALKPAALFREAAHPLLAPRWWGGVFYLPAVLLYWGLASSQAHTWEQSTWFALSLAAAGVGLGGVAWLGLRSLERLRRVRPLSLRLALRNLERNRGAAAASFLALGISALLINVVPQFRSSLETEVERPDASSIPSLFLFDIQDEQVEPLRSHVRAAGRELVQLSPMIRARLNAIDGERIPPPGAGSGEEESQRDRMLHRAHNLSYRPGLSGSERLVAGRDLRGRYDPDSGELPEMTLDREFADWLDVPLEGTVEFDVQGVPVLGRVVGLREIRWSSFEPNFFVQFQPGLLEDAPKTHLAALPPMDRDAKERMQYSIAREFPNVSAIDVSAVIGRLLGVMDQVRFATAFMAGLSLLAGAVLLYAIASHQAAERRWETCLLKVLGAGFGRVRALVRWEFGLLAAAASTLGAAAGLTLSAILAQRLLGADWNPDWWAPPLSVAGITALALLTSELATRRVLRERPLALLRHG